MMQAYQTNEVLQDGWIVRGFCLVQSNALAKAMTQPNDAGPQPRLEVKRGKWAFPTPDSVKSAKDAVFCDADRIIALYNKHHGGSQQKITSPVKAWFTKEAYRAGWEDVVFLTNIQASRCAGFMLRAPAQSWGKV
ncbi:hypothetical protein ACET6Q_18180 [Aeromonas dhakensis]|uniref:hypothetical protein n=2 Tax=Aeromonas TaxID=642 RepID=UPI0038D076E9